jgi:hypothetical protein
MHTILSYGMGVESTGIMWDMKVKSSRVEDGLNLWEPNPPVSS